VQSIAHLIRFNKSSDRFPAFCGAGYEFNSTQNPEKRNNLPFFKQYFSGGPNSMRALGFAKTRPWFNAKRIYRTIGNTGSLW
jgi:hypothetical protein